jgi:uncharacterized protein (DUF302 family)
MRSLIHPFSMVATTPRDYDDAVARTREVLEDEGFGIVSEIDVRETFERELGLEYEPYLIFGACDATYAHLALELDPELGTLLPCNVIVYVRDGLTHVSAVDPERLMSVADRAELEPTAHAIHGRLQRIVDRVVTC